VTTIPSARRERARATTRRAIQDAALRLFAERGFDQVTVEEVAASADVSARTVFRYFPTKESLVLADLARRQAELLDIIDRLPAGDTLGGLLARAAVEWAADNRDPRLLRNEASLIDATPALRGRLQQMTVGWEDPIASRLAERSGRPPGDLEISQLAALFCASIRIVVREWATNEVEADILDFGRRALDALMALPAGRLPA